MPDVLCQLLLPPELRGGCTECCSKALPMPPKRKARARVP